MRGKRDRLMLVLLYALEQRFGLDVLCERHDGESSGWKAKVQDGRVEMPSDSALIDMSAHKNSSVDSPRSRVQCMTSSSFPPERNAMLDAMQRCRATETALFRRRGPRA